MTTEQSHAFVRQQDHVHLTATEARCVPVEASAFHLAVGQDTRSPRQGIPTHLPDLGIGRRPQNDPVNSASFLNLVRHPVNEVLSMT